MPEGSRGGESGFGSACVHAAGSSPGATVLTETQPDKALAVIAAKKQRERGKRDESMRKQEVSLGSGAGGDELRSCGNGWGKVGEVKLQQAEFGADQGDGGEGGGLGAEDARAEMREGEGVGAEESAFAGGPTALGAESDDDGFVT